ncbi:MAG: YdcF family protein [Cyanobacteria bacterium P01_A01_bin.105]
MKKMRGPYLKYGCMGLVAAIATVGTALALSLLMAARHPVDSYLVLGGSIRREMYMAEQAVPQPSLPILISSGSQDPCIRLLFDQAGASLDQVWLEKCAQSTFSNYRFSLPVLKQWQVRHVRLVTSGSHTRRAVWMARIILGGHGIWVTPEIVEEVGIPGNQESPLKTTLDLARSLLWVGISQVYRPECGDVLPLVSVDLAQWRQQGFKCEHQAGIEGS